MFYFDFLDFYFILFYFFFYLLNNEEAYDCGHIICHMILCYKFKT